MPQKMVLKVSMTGEKSRREAMKAAIDGSGIIKSIAIDGPNRDRLVIVGDGMDSANLTTQLRKRMGFTFSCSAKGVLNRRNGSVELLSVTTVDGKQEQNKDKVEQQEWGKVVNVLPYYQPLAYNPQYVVREPVNDSCHIL